MIEKVQEIIKAMKEYDVRSIDFYGEEIDVRVNGVAVLKNFDKVQIEPSENVDGIFHVESVVDGIAFRGAINDEELAEYQKAKEVA
mgnify:CR=1 FL=1